MPRWFRRLLLIVLELLGAAIAAAVVLMGLLAWRLSSGPLRLEALEPYLMSGLAQLAEPYKVSIGQTAVIWGSDRTSLGLEASQVRIMTPEGVTVALVPEIEIGISVPALLFGRVAPTLISLTGPQLRAVRTAGGDVRLSLFDTTPDNSTDTANSEDILGKWLEAMMEAPEASSQYGALRRLFIRSARLEVNDYQLGLRWLAPRLDIALRRDSDGMRGNLALNVQLGDHVALVESGLLYDRASALLRFDLALDRFNPSELAHLSPSLSDLERVNVPFSGKLSLYWMRPIGVSRIGFDLKAGEGQVALVTGQKPLDVTAARLSGLIDRQQRSVEISALNASFGATEVQAHATAVREGNAIRVKAVADARNMSAADLPRYWPEYVARGAHNWVTRNIVEGNVPAAHASVGLLIPLADVHKPDVTDLEGTMEVNGATVHYFRPLPPATNAHGVATFNRDVFNVKVDRAQVGNLRITEANIDLLGLHDNADRADISLTVNGTVADQLRLLDHEPLKYMQRLHINGAAAQGRATTRARFMFPLFGNLPIADVAISAASTMTNVSLPSVVMGQALTKGQLALALDGGGMKISGTGNIGPAAAEFSWQESFVDDVSPNSEIAFKGMLNEEGRQAFHVSWQDVLQGDVAVDGRYAKDRGQPAQLTADLDFAKATLTLPWFAWRKPVGAAGTGSVAVTINQNQVKEVSRFEVKAGPALVRGSVAFASGSQWQRVKLDRVTAPGTSLSGTVGKLEGGGFSLDFKGNNADIRGIYEPLDKPAAEAVTAAQAPRPAMLPLDIRFDLGRVVTGEGRMLRSAVGHIIRNERGWKQLEIDGKLENDIPMRIRLVPTATGRSLSIETQNAGAMLSTLRLMDNIRGGTMSVSGTGDGTDPVKAVADMRNFLYLQPETLRRIAEAADPKGADVLARGEGIEFTRLKARLLYGEDYMEVREGRMASEVLGLTLSGRVDLLQSRLDINGTLVPLYGINSAVGGIPVIGWLLTGGDGGGIFAATFSVKGPLSAPETSVNPLAMLAPGFLRNILFLGD